MKNFLLTSILISFLIPHGTNLKVGIRIYSFDPTQKTISSFREY